MYQTERSEGKPAVPSVVNLLRCPERVMNNSHPCEPQSLARADDEEVTIEMHVETRCTAT